jgi:hypothetical protein
MTGDRTGTNGKKPDANFLSAALGSLRLRGCASCAACNLCWVLIRPQRASFSQSFNSMFNAKIYLFNVGTADPRAPKMPIRVVRIGARTYTQAAHMFCATTGAGRKTRI